MNNKEILEYLKSAGITIALMILVIIGIVVYERNHIKQHPSLDEMKKLKTNQIVTVISKYESDLKLNPKNYFLNMKLGMLYETLNKLDIAEQQYDIATRKAAYRDFEPTFLLSNLYIKMEKPDEARKVIDKIKEYPDKTLIKKKSIIYYKIGDLYLEQKKYDEAITQFKNSLFYLKKLPYNASLKKQDQIIKQKLALSYAHLSEKADSPTKAANILLRGIELTNSAYLMNNLAILLNKNNESEQALKWFQSAQKRNSNYVNFKEYEYTLKVLENQAIKNQDDKLTKYYGDKRRRLKEFMQTNVLSKNDLLLEVKKTHYKLLPLYLGYEAMVGFILRNNSAEDIAPLSMIVKVYDDKKLINTYEQKLVYKGYPLKSGRITKQIDCKIKTNLEPEENSQNIKFEIYCKKSNKLNPILIQTILIPKTST